MITALRTCLLILSTAPMLLSVEIGIAHVSQAIDDNSSPKEGTTLRLVAPRGGSATGLILVRAAQGQQAVAQARFTREGLRHNRQRSATLDDHVHIWYGSRHIDFAPDRNRPNTDQAKHYDALVPAPHEPGRVLPIYVHLDIPADAQPGRYDGTLQVRGRGASADIALEIVVAPFVVPPPQQRQAWVDTLQSPDSVAYRYGVPLYSRQHLQLMRPVLEMQAKLGQRVMHVTTIAQTHFGNDEAMIPIGDRGIDFSGFEGYLALFNEIVGEPTFVVVYAVERGGNTGGGSAMPHWTPPGGQRQGSTTPVKVGFGQQHRATWQAAMEGIKQRVERVGWNNSEILMGWIGDGRPLGDYFKLFSEVAPFARWVAFTHARGDPSPNNQGQLVMLGMDVAYRILPYPPASVEKRKPASGGGWNYPFLQATTHRHYNADDSAPLYWLNQLNHGVQGGGGRVYRGVARIGMDFWPVQQPNGNNGRLMGRFARWHNLQRNTARAITVPGPQGALPTVRYLAFRQGIEETEARILIEQALAANRLPQGVNRAQVEELLKIYHSLRIFDGKFVPPENEPEILGGLFQLAGVIQGAR